MATCMKQSEWNSDLYSTYLVPCSVGFSQAGFVPDDHLTGRHICFRAFALAFLSAGMQILHNSPSCIIIFRCLLGLLLFQSSSVQSLSRVWLFATPWTAAHQASLSITNSRSPPKLMSIKSVMPSNHLILIFITFQSFLSIWGRYVAGPPPAPTGIPKSVDVQVLYIQWHSICI